MGALLDQFADFVTVPGPGLRPARGLKAQKIRAWDFGFFDLENFSCQNC